MRKKKDALVALGTPVTYTHRSTVARRWPGRGSDKGLWRAPPYEFLYRQGEPTICVSVSPYEAVVAHELIDREQWVNDKRWAERNKTVLYWAQEGSGVIVGHVRRCIGTSHSSQYEDDIGYFDTLASVGLYVVKDSLTGPEILVPEGAIRIVHSLG